VAAITRKGDMGSGHGCYPPRPNIAGSSNVFINGIGAHRVGDAWPVHACTSPPPAPHAGTLAAGSGTVFVNGKSVGRIGDPVDCGSTVAAGSSNVFAGG
jgi:uncharacterized Zn-binding protein involved in type VI secretion